MQQGVSHILSDSTELLMCFSDELGLTELGPEIAQTPYHETKSLETTAPVMAFRSKF